MKHFYTKTFAADIENVYFSSRTRHTALNNHLRSLLSEDYSLLERNIYELTTV